MTLPTVSIVVRTRGDRNEWLVEALESLARQSWPVEPVVVFDAFGFPPVFAGRTIQRLMDLVDSIRPAFAHQQVTVSNGAGEACAANRGVQVATGELVGFLDDDDVLRSYHVERLVNALTANVNAVAAYDDVQLVLSDERNKPVTKGLIFSGAFTYEQLRETNRRPNMAFLVRREALAANPFETSDEPCDDWGVWLRAFRERELVHVPGVGAEYRIRTDRSQFTTREPELLERKALEIRARYRA